MSKLFSREGDPRVADLRQRLDDFYITTTTYETFLDPKAKPDLWVSILPEVKQRIAATGTCRILEFGAGRTSFREFMGELSSRTQFDVQDITPQNRDYLASQADRVFICDLRDLNETYDIIFSTFVWEHLAKPQESLDYLLRLLSPGGALILASPRYDWPFYISPSAKHYSTLKRLKIGLWLIARRLRVRLGGRADFLIHLDPAVLHGPWFRDADAIHWVSIGDLPRYLGRDYQISRLKPAALPLRGLRPRLMRFFFTHALLLFVRIQKGPGSDRENRMWEGEAPAEPGRKPQIAARPEPRPPFRLRMR